MRGFSVAVIAGRAGYNIGSEDNRYSGQHSLVERRMHGSYRVLVVSVEPYLADIMQDGRGYAWIGWWCCIPPQ